LVKQTRVGYLIRKTRKFIVMCSEKVDEYEHIREPMSIPRGWVISITELNRGKVHHPRKRTKAEGGTDAVGAHTEGGPNDPDRA